MQIEDQENRKQPVELILDSRQDSLAMYLAKLETELKQQGLWVDVPPPQSALESSEPFCVDTLPFEQWLQFVMIPTFYGLIQRNLALPKQCSVAPMAEEAFKSQAVGDVMILLARIDKLLSVS